MRTAIAGGMVALLAACGGAPGPRPWLTDVTAGSGLSLVTTSGRTPSTQLLEVKGGGVALVDFDGDGDLDVFVPNGATLDAPEAGPGARLFESLGGLRFRDATDAAGLTFRRWGFGAAVADYDADGRDDVYVACFGRNALLHNVGGRFEDVTEAAGAGGGERWSTAAAWGDVDGDGDLDLYVVNYVRFDPAAPPPATTFLGAQVFGGPMGLEAEPDLLLENRGDGTFRDATAARGMAGVPPSYGLGAVVVDLDDDGRQDVFVGNDSQANFLFHNGGDGRFEERGVASGLALSADGWGQATMGIALADVDGDGRVDLFTSNFMSDDNTLHLQRAPLVFRDATRAWGLGAASRPYLGWASLFIDLDLDGDEDLVVFNGHTYPETITGPRGWRHDQEPLCFERVDQRFERLDPARGGAWLAEARCDRSAAAGDLDGDGDPDLVVTSLNGPLRLLRNEARGTWLAVRLADPGSMNPRGLGSRVDLSAGDRTMGRWIVSGPSYQASSAAEAWFGLGAHAGTVTLTVTWPDGQRQTVEGVAPDRRVTVERGA